MQIIMGPHRDNTGMVLGYFGRIWQNLPEFGRIWQIPLLTLPAGLGVAVVWCFVGGALWFEVLSVFFVGGLVVWWFGGLVLRFSGVGTDRWMRPLLCTNAMPRATYNATCHMPRHMPRATCHVPHATPP